MLPPARIPVGQQRQPRPPATAAAGARTGREARGRGSRRTLSVVVARPCRPGTVHLLGSTSMDAARAPAGLDALTELVAPERVLDELEGDAASRLV